MLSYYSKQSPNNNIDTELNGVITLKQIITRNLFILTWITLSWMPLASVPASAANAEGLPYVQDFTVEGKAAQAKHLPILVLFMSPHCVYCEKVLREFLLPMTRNADYKTKVIMRQIDIGSNAKLRDFNGVMTTQKQFASASRVQLIPTVKLFDSQGKELTEPIIGLLTVDFYGGYLDNAIDEALAKVNVKEAP